jgi:hypothetical protein
MSDAVHAHPPEGGSASSKTWAAAGTVLSIMLAVIVILWIVGMFLSPAAGGIQQIVAGFKLVNQSLFGFKYESNLLIINLMQIVVLPALLFVLLKYWAFK